MTTWDITPSGARSAIGRTKTTAEEYVDVRRLTRKALDSAQLASGSVRAKALAAFADEHDREVDSVATRTGNVTGTGDSLLTLYLGGDEEIAGEITSRLGQAQALHGRFRL
jgi:Family of unknown function (DUF6507)